MPNIAELLALVVAFGGLAAVIAEVWIREPALFGALVGDVRRLAEPARERGAPAPTVSTTSLPVPVPANSHRCRRAA